MSPLRDLNCQVCLVNKTQFGSQASINIIYKITKTKNIPRPHQYHNILWTNFLPYHHEMLRKGSYRELNYLFVVFALRRPYFNWKALCFERVMHYFETQVPPLTPLTLLKRQKIE